MLIAQGEVSNPGPGLGSHSSQGQSQRNVTRAGTSYSSILRHAEGAQGEPPVV